MNTKLKAVSLFLLGLTFGVLLLGGYMIRRSKPPIPERVLTNDHQVVFTGKDVVDGQNFYFSQGGQHIGSIWGHGAYLAPDWSADFLHRTGLYLAARYHGLEPTEARTFSQKEFDQLPAEVRAVLTAKVTEEIKENRFEEPQGTLRYTPFQSEAFAFLIDYYTDLFQQGEARMGIQPGIVTTAEEGRRLTAFFAWLA